MPKQTAIVTGAASGMGRVMALALSEAGFDVVAVDRNAAALSTLPAPIKPIAVDLAQPSSFGRIVSETMGAFGRIDVLINNAGIGQASIRADQRGTPMRFWEVTPEQWNRFLTVNATAPIMLSHAVVPHMLKAGSGRIITVTTSLGTMVREGYLLYGASKAATEAAMASLAADLAGTGVTSNVLVPGGGDRHAIGWRRGRSFEDVAARDHDTAAVVARLRRGGHDQRPAIHRGGLGYAAVACPGGRGRGRPNRLAEHRSDADPADLMSCPIGFGAVCVVRTRVLGTSCEQRALGTSCEKRVLGTSCERAPLGRRANSASLGRRANARPWDVARTRAFGTSCEQRALEPTSHWDQQATARH